MGWIGAAWGKVARCRWWGWTPLTGWLELTLTTALRYPAACETYQLTFVSYCSRAQSWKKFQRRRGLKSRRDRKLHFPNRKLHTSDRAQGIMGTQSFNCVHKFPQNRRLLSPFFGRECFDKKRIFRYRLKFGKTIVRWHDTTEKKSMNVHSKHRENKPRK